MAARRRENIAAVIVDGTGLQDNTYARQRLLGRTFADLGFILEGQVFRFIR